MDYDEYIEYINHLFLQRMLDDEYYEFVLKSNQKE